MRLLDQEEFLQYVKEHHEMIFETDDYSISREIPGICDACGRDAFLKIHSRSYSYAFQLKELPSFVNFLIECPKCRRRSFLQTLQVEKRKIVEEEGKKISSFTYEYFKLYRLPISEESFINEDIPSEHKSLRKTVSEANYCLTNSQFIASAILFRRAIQIVVKEVLGAKGKTLFNQLEWLKSNPNNLAIDLTDVFHDSTKIIKDIGNQGAHPDDDITLHDFKKEDANGLHDLFISIIHEIFIKPAKMKALKDELKANRKLK